jgi:8-oxo-dGTP diphosphatase
MNLSEESLFREQAKRDGITHLSTGVAIWKDGKILIVRRATADYLGGQYELPGGGVDGGETLTEAAIREVKEETGLTVSKVISVFNGFDYSTDRKPRVRQINFLVEAENEDVILNPLEHDEFQWVDAGTGLDGLMSANMKICVTEAVRLTEQMHLYLFTLEVDPLVVGDVYNPLPSHLTLVSRFWSELSYDEIAKAVSPTLAKSEPVELIFGKEAVIGPKKTAVHLVENTLEIRNLHSQLLKALTKLKVSFTSPQFIGEGHRPHVSKRQDVEFLVGHKQVAGNVYLIEVEIVGKEHLRKVRAKFKLGS